MLKILTVGLVATVMLSSCSDNGTNHYKNNDGTFNIKPSMIEIDRETGFHYLKANNSSSYMPRYCLTKDNTRGQIMTKDNRFDCISLN
jgi:hypothetical protein